MRMLCCRVVCGSVGLAESMSSTARLLNSRRVWRISSVQALLRTPFHHATILRAVQGRVAQRARGGARPWPAEGV